MSRGSSHVATRARLRAASALGALLATCALLAGCGQRGPLTLPDSARPIERLPGTAAPAQPGSTSPAGVAQPAPGAATGITAPAQREPGSEDEESQNKARRPENER